MLAAVHPLLAIPIKIIKRESDLDEMLDSYLASGRSFILTLKLKKILPTMMLKLAQLKKKGQVLQCDFYFCDNYVYLVRIANDNIKGDEYEPHLTFPRIIPLVK